MPKVEQHDWGKLSPKKLTYPYGDTGTKDFTEHEYVEARSNSKHGTVKVSRPPRNVDKEQPKVRYHMKNRVPYKPVDNSTS